MSTLKTDTIVAVSTNGDLSLDGLGTGGVSIASTLKMTKGGDIASASPLVIDVDGNYFDVTGTTNFSAMTVESGNFFMLQFDGALTITHGSGIELPGAANLTTATGDRLICYATAANTVEVMSVETEAAAAGGSWNLIGTSVASASASLTVTGLDSTYDTYAIAISDMVPATDNVNMYFRLGDSGGIDSGSTDYSYASRGHREDGSPYDVDSTGAAQIEFCGSSGSASGEGFGAMMYLHRPGDGTTKPMITWDAIVSDITGLLQHHYGGGMRDAVIAVDRVQVIINTGNIASGRLTVWGLAHA